MYMSRKLFYLYSIGIFNQIEVHLKFCLMIVQTFFSFNLIFLFVKRMFEMFPTQNIFFICHNATENDRVESRLNPIDVPKLYLPCQIQRSRIRAYISWATHASWAVLVSSDN